MADQPASPRLSEETAAAIAAPLVRCAADLDTVLHDLRDHAPREEFEAARAMVARTMAEIYVAALYPIFEAFPDLKPRGYP